MTTAFDNVSEAALELLGERPTHIVPLEGGANNVGLRVLMANSTVFAKQYFSHARDTRDRLGAEFGMLSFLWQNGVRCIPQPLVSDPARRIGFYEYVDGTTPLPGSITESDVDALSELLGAMWQHRHATGASQLPAAADAAYRISDYIECVQRRMESVRDAAAQAGQPEAFVAFVRRTLEPAFASLQTRVSHQLHSCGIDPAMLLAADAMTLSPADHGFHNTLRRLDGSLVFLDFEYAGWDDPAQMICNACLQPRVPMTTRQISSFVRSMLARIEGSTALVDRLRIAFPLLGFKWALIMLNEFLPVGADRRRFAGTNPELRRAEQLDKARRQLLKMEAYAAGGDIVDGLNDVNV